MSTFATQTLPRGEHAGNRLPCDSAGAGKYVQDQGSSVDFLSPRGLRGASLLPGEVS